MRFLRWLIVAAIAGIVVIPHDVESCGPAFSRLLFSTRKAMLPGEFSSGRPGVVQKTYDSADLLLAYRLLSGIPPESGDRARPLPEQSPAYDRAKPWLEARKQVPGAADISSLEGDKKVPGEDYQMYANCLAGAFETAAETLGKRIAQWSASSPNVKQWLSGQDQVFDNCGGGPSIPDAITSGDPLLVADRRYQIAAAKFYAEQYNDAERAFDEIAADQRSPWREIAPYLAARACIRMRAWDRAAGRLRKILADPSRRSLHSSAQGLLDYVRARSEPEERLVELGDQLMKPAGAPPLGRILTDYTKILRRLDSGAIPAVAKRSEVADWVTNMQSGEGALAKWRAKRTQPWLVAALAETDPRDPAAKELVAAASEVRPDSPAYASASYYAVESLIQAGNADAARTWADQALATRQSDSARNLFLGQRFLLARNWTEFLKFAPRKPVALEADDWEEPFGDADAERHPVAFDVDAVKNFNQAVPLSLWTDAAQNPLLPRSLQISVAQAGFARAAILGDTTNSQALGKRLAQLKPDLAAEVRAYLAVTDPGAAKFHAVFLMLRAPGLSPVVRAGLQRDTPVLKLDDFRDNWWLVPAARPADAPKEPEISNALPPAQRAAGEQEWQRLVKTAGNSVNFMAAETIEWAKTHTADPRLPEALHLTVRATRYGPADKASSAFSKEAFELLHKRYPKSEWAQKTKYWY